jgi:lactoylglutathione lyase
VARYLHTMVRISDPAKSRAFYEALGFQFSREMDIVRNGEVEATNYFFSIGDQDNVLELTHNHDGRSYELGTAYGHIAVGVDNLDSRHDRARHITREGRRGFRQGVASRRVRHGRSRSLMSGSSERRIFGLALQRRSAPPGWGSPAKTSSVTPPFFSSS